MNNQSKQPITIPAEVLGLSDVEIELVTTDLRARQITIRVVSTKDEILAWFKCSAERARGNETNFVVS